MSGIGAALLTWGAVVHGRLGLAEQDARRLRGGDPVAIGFLERFGTALLEDPPPQSAAELYARWRRSPLSTQDYPGVLATWASDGRQVASLALAELELRPPLFAVLADAARVARRVRVQSVELDLGVHYVAAVPFEDGTVITAGVAPRSRLIRPVLVGRFLRGERRLVAPYELSLGEAVVAGGAPDGVDWQRDRWTVHATQVLARPEGSRALHLTVPLRDLSQLLVRGALLVIVACGVLGLLSVGAGTLRGPVRVPAVFREIVGLRSYRIRLALALAGFFVIPTLGFAAWSIGRIQADAARSRDLLIQQTLREAVGTSRQFSGMALDQVGVRLEDLAARVGADLVWYEDGVLAQSSTPVLAELGLLDVHLPPRVFLALLLEQEVELTADAEIGGRRTRVGYRRLAGAGAGTPVLASPRLVDVGGVMREQEDLAFGLLLVTVLGLGGAVALAAVAARTLAQPVQALRQAAVAVGSGAPPPPFGPNVPTEFSSVMDAFERMAYDVKASQAALEAARRRTATVLSTVATGVVAVDAGMRVTIANPRAEELLGVRLDPGVFIAEATAPEWQSLWAWVRAFLEGDAALDAREFSVGARRYRAQVAVLHADPGGCVVALDDTTDLARAVRVLAWGELARQVAHEIKNPLTPIRLGVQHLQRARRHGRADFDATLERTSQQILAEIERLDAIARAFARFGAPPAEHAPPVPADVVAIARDAAALYSLGGKTGVRVEATGPVEGLVHKDEVKEVLINLVENARDAEATEVVVSVTHRSAGGAEIEVRDNGRGIPPEDLPHIFEPQFSTTTSGTGLGLAICRRLVESWGGTIAVQSEVRRGTTVRIGLRGGAG